MEAVSAPEMLEARNNEESAVISEDAGLSTSKDESSVKTDLVQPGKNVEAEIKRILNLLKPAQEKSTEDVPVLKRNTHFHPASGNEVAETSASQISSADLNSNVDVPDRMKALGLAAFDFTPEDRILPVPEELIKNNRTSSSSLSIGFGISPDLSGAGLGSFSQPGNNLALLLEWRIGRRFSISTGLIRSRKIYSVEDGFLPYPGIWKKIPKPDLVDGSCNVFDIPMNLRYNLNAGVRNDFFVSSGISSYIMQAEEYEYVYDDKPYADYVYEVYNDNRHLFGVMNFSVGYERRLSPNWSAQVEPFIKVPLTEIGMGNLNLYSSGVFLHLKYHFRKIQP